MAVRQWSLDCLWSWLGAAILVVSLLPAGLYATHMFSVFAERNLVGRAEALAATLARQIIEILLVQDAIALHESLEKAIAADEQIRYAAVEDNHGNIVVHTFAEGFPAALRALWATPERVVRYSAGDDRLIDVSSPILGGQLGKLHVGISRAQAYAASNRALLLVGTAFLGGILIIVVGIQVISTSVSRPLGRLEMLVSRYPAAASGDAGTPWWNNGGLEVGGTREVQSLAKQFRHMVQKLDSLEQERLATQKSLICAERLATLGELASGLAHEIRNPLDGVQECIRCLQADPEKSEQAARYYPMMQQGLQRISRTIQEMLIFARSGQSVSPKRCHMSVVFDQLKLLVIPHMERREIDIRWHTEQDLICFCDPDALAQTKTSILIVEDEPLKRSVLTDGLHKAGYSVTAAFNPIQAEQELAKHGADIVLTDLRMPGQDGLTFLRHLKKERPQVSVIVMTAYGSVETAVEAMKLGAFDYLQKPFSTEELLLKLDKLLEYGKLRVENESLRRQLAQPAVEGGIVARSESMRAVLARIHTIAKTDATALIEGESGVGKELVAREIHASSHRCTGPFVPVSCAALPAELIESELFGYEAGAFTGAGKRRLGRFELAHGGSLFLDDIDDIPLELQVKLVRVLQERVFERVGGEVVIRANIRLLASTKASLPTLVAAGKFREDLFYRINVIPLRILPLRERREDIPPLVEHFLARSCLKMNRERMSVSAPALARLVCYGWPGNVRELEHVVERMVVLAQKSVLDEDDLPDLGATDDRPDGIISIALDGLTRVDMPSLLSDVETKLLNWALGRAGGNLAHAAELLGVPRSTLQYKISRLVPHSERCSQPR